MEKAIYQGPYNYWTEHTLVPQEKYLYGYYGHYTPNVDLNLYRPIQEQQDLIIEGYNGGCGCSSNGIMWSAILLIVVLSFLRYR